jgi:glutathione peroxidase
MRHVALVVVVVAVTLAGCGDDSSPSQPAAATDTTVQPATTPLPRAAGPDGAGPQDAGPRAAGPDGAGPQDAGPRAAATESAAPRSSAARADAPPPPPPPPPPTARPRASSVLHGTYRRLNGESEDLARYSGRVVLVVNTATECGFTPQFEGLEALYRSRSGDGLVVLGFPANDFAGQEPRSDKEIATFCKANYGVSFPMFSKTHVVGDAANPLFRKLNAAAGEPEWNFNKYLVDRDGAVVARYGAGTEPEGPELAQRVKHLLAAKA